MSTIHDRRKQNVSEFLSVLPSSLGFQSCTLDEHQYELRSDHCVIKFMFERYDPSSAGIEISSPTGSSDGMAYWILRHIRCVAPTEEEKSSFRRFGEVLADNFGDVLQGDFSIQIEYDDVSERIMDRMFDVESLPLDHPTRLRFDRFDLQWLSDLESADLA